MTERWRELEARYGESGIHRVLGLSLAVNGLGDVEVSYDGRPEAGNRAGNTAGGALSQMIDSCVMQAAATHVEPGDGLTTLELKVNFVKPAPPGGKLTARGLIKHIGRTTAVGTGEIADEQGNIVAIGLVTVALRRR